MKTKPTTNHRMRTIASHMVKGFPIQLTPGEKEDMYSALILAMQWGLPDRLKQPDPAPSPTASQQTATIKVNWRR